MENLKILWDEWKQTQHTKTYGMPQTKCSKGNVQLSTATLKKTDLEPIT